jgi:voltage-gated potassium channel
MHRELSRRFRRAAVWGLRLAPGEVPRARVVERGWRWPVVLALLLTIPAFYAELLDVAPPALAALAYGLAAAVVALALGHTAACCGPAGAARHLRANPLDSLLVAGLLLAALAPPSASSAAALALRLGVALLSLLRMVWAMQSLITRGGLMSMGLTAALILGGCGVGFWWLEPRALTLGDGLWLAFTTAATVGYGDIVPSTPASKIFSVFVVMLGYGVLSLVTAAIATQWVETEERLIEREILRDVHHQMDALRAEIAALRDDLQRPRSG